MTAWVMHNVNWIRQRHEFLAAESETWQIRNGLRWSFQVGRDVQAPGQLRFFGERGLHSVPVIVDNKSLAELSEADQEHILLARRLFPEAALFGYWFWIPEPRLKRTGSFTPDPDTDSYRLLGLLPDPLPDNR